jgi:hypothetical protein
MSNPGDRTNYWKSDTDHGFILAILETIKKEGKKEKKEDVPS